MRIQQQQKLRNGYGGSDGRVAVVVAVAAAKCWRLEKFYLDRWVRMRHVEKWLVG